MLRFNLIILRTLTYFSFFLFLGCKSEDPNPELLDPIYKSLLDQTHSFKNDLEAEEKKLEDLEKDLLHSEPISAERKKLRQNIEISKAKIIKFKQMYEYGEIRAEHRRLQARKDYKIAFRQGQPWPNAKEYEYFMTHQKLQTSSRNWSTRVPKLQDRQNQMTPIRAPSAEEKKSAHGG